MTLLAGRTLLASRWTVIVDVWDAATTTYVSMSSVHPCSFAGVANKDLEEFASRINWDLRVGFFDVYPLGCGDIKFVTRCEAPRVDSVHLGGRRAAAAASGTPSQAGRRRRLAVVPGPA